MKRPFRQFRWLAIVSFILTGFSHTTQAESFYTAGVEGFRDTYRESGTLVDTLTGDPVGRIDVDTHSEFKSALLQYMHVNNNFFSAIDGRYSSGTSDYKSSSGTLNGDPEWETDLRMRTGLSMAMWHGHMMPYIGLGWRYYFDNGKDHFTSTGAEAYDRHISQFYFPVGATYNFTEGNWTFSPNLEGDFMFWGQVNSHLGEVPGYTNATNIQRSGVGVRSEFMFGQQYKYFGWQVGPFLRYWHIQQSDLKDKVPLPGGTSAGSGEPTNTRLQYGTELRVTY